MLHQQLGTEDYSSGFFTSEWRPFICSCYSELKAHIQSSTGGADRPQLPNHSAALHKGHARTSASEDVRGLGGGECCKKWTGARKMHHQDNPLMGISNFLTSNIILKLNAVKTRRPTELKFFCESGVIIFRRRLMIVYGAFKLPSCICESPSH